MNDKAMPPMPQLPKNYRFAVRENRVGGGYYYLVLEQKKLWIWVQVQDEMIAAPDQVFNRPHSFPAIGENLWKHQLQKTGQIPGPFPKGVLY